VLQHELQEVFSTSLDDAVITSLSTQEPISIRRIKASLETALANAAVRVKKDGKKVFLKVDDLPRESERNVKQKMGFIH